MYFWLNPKIQIKRAKRYIHPYIHTYLFTSYPIHKISYLNKNNQSYAYIHKYISYMTIADSQKKATINIRPCSFR